MESATDYSRQIRYVVAGGAVVVAITFAFGWMAMSRFADAQSRWEEFNQRSSIISTTLLKIQSHIGYGGFIHNFKNLVLRRDTLRYQHRIDDNLTELETEFNRLDNLLILPEDKRQLATVRNTVEEYAGKYRIALDMIKAGHNSDEIDAVVKVDDGPALEAFTALTERIQAHTNATETATRRSYDEARVFMQFGGLITAMSIFLAMTIMVGYLRKITVAHEATSRLEVQLSTLLDTSPDPMISVAPGGRIVRANQMAEQFFGYDQGMLIGMEIEALIPERYRQGHRRLRDGFFSAPHNRPMGGGLMLKALTRDGREPDVEINLSYTGEGSERFATIAVRDVTERERHRMEHILLEEAKSAAEVAAASDFLTGLNNRRQLLHLSTSLVANANRNSMPMAVAMLDIDHFKDVNDTWGHDAGDAVLKAVASQLKERFRATDIVARFGGEEFCVVAVNLDQDAASELFDSFRENLAAHPIDVGGMQLNITISIGVTTALADSIEKMISCADVLLYRAKREGRNRVVMA